MRRSQKKTRFLPEKTEIGERFGAVQEGEREGAYIKNWQDFEIAGCAGAHVHTEQKPTDADDAQLRNFKKMQPHSYIEKFLTESILAGGAKPLLSKTEISKTQNAVTISSI